MRLRSWLTAYRQRSSRVRRTPGRVSVVIPCYDVAEYLDEALTSVRRQSHRDLQIIVVDDGSTDGTVALAQRHATADPRVRVLQQAHAGQGAARNRALAVADGEYLTFMDADDVVPKHAYATMVRTLAGSGSDFCLGHVRRFDRSGTWTSAWASETHATACTGTTIDERPVAIKDIIACNRMYRRTFWDDAVGTFPEGTVYEDHVPMLRSFLHGARFDVLTEVTYRWRARENGTSTGQQKAQLSNLEARVQVKRDAWAMLQAEGSPAIRSAWLGRVLDVDLPAFYGPALDSDPAYRDLLQQTVAHYLGLADEAALTLVRAHMGVAGWLVAQGRWTDVATVRELTAPGGPARDGVIAGGEVLLDVARLPVDLTGLPSPALLRLTAHQSRATAAVHRVETSDDAVRLVGLVRQHGVAPGEPLLLEVDAVAGSRVEAVPATDVAAEPPPGAVGFAATVPWPTAGQVQPLALQVRSGSLVRTARLGRTARGRAPDAGWTHRLPDGRAGEVRRLPDGLAVTTVTS